MPKKSPKYWIATYSAHTDILKQIIGDQGEIVKLCVDNGGLRAARGAFSLANKIKYPKSRTLHAKILLKENGSQKPCIWLWTGNIRAATFESQNILLSLPLDKKKKSLKTLKSWFSELDASLIFRSNGISITDVFKQRTRNLWGEIERSISNTLKTNDSTDCKLYAISPWGSAKFIQTIFGKKFSEINLYTRYEDKTEPLWIDFNPSSDNNEIIVNRMTANKSGIFPHMKCMFITKKDKLVWTYIGSANFTKKAMFDGNNTSNIEYALLFEGENFQKKELKNLFKNLTEEYKDSNGKGWRKRKQIREINDAEGDESNQSLRYEQDFNESITDDGYRTFFRKIYPILKLKKNQKKMDKHYREYGKKDWLELDGGKFKIKIDSIDNYYHILAKENKKNLVYEIDFERSIEEEVPIDSEYAQSILNSLTSSTQPKGKGSKGHGEIEFSSEKFINIRFIAKQYIDKKGKIRCKEVNETYDKLKKIQKANLTGSTKTMNSIWWNMIKALQETTHE